MHISGLLANVLHAKQYPRLLERFWTVGRKKSLQSLLPEWMVHLHHISARMTVLVIKFRCPSQNTSPGRLGPKHQGKSPASVIEMFHLEKLHKYTSGTFKVALTKTYIASCVCYLQIFSDNWILWRKRNLTFVNLWNKCNFIKYYPTQQIIPVRTSAEYPIPTTFCEKDLTLQSWQKRLLVCLVNHLSNVISKLLLFWHL